MTGTPFDLTDEQVALRALAADVASEHFAPLADEIEETGCPISPESIQLLADLGFLGIALPLRYGGGGGSLADALLVVEELAKVCRPAAFQVFEANVGPVRVIELFGTEEQRRRYIPAVASGEITMAIGISEPDAGSAATDMRTRASASGADLVITGNKRWISNGGHASHYLVYCRLDDRSGASGIGAVVVPGDAEGLSFGRPEALMGFRGIPSADLYFDDVRVPASDIVVPAGGFRDLFGAFSIERLGNATMSLAIGQAALDASIAYVQERHQFGRPLLEFQSIQTTLADMCIQVDAARLLILRAASRADGGLPNPLEVSIAKCFANEMAKRVSDLAMQVHGGNGYSREFGLERLHRDAHGWAIAGGTPVMQRIRIASQLFNRSFSQRREPSA